MVINIDYETHHFINAVVISSYNLLEKNILSKNPYVVTEFGKEYSFYSRKDDSLVGTIEITCNLELISVNLKYESNESQEINLERYLPKFFTLEGKRRCFVNKQPVLESILINGTDYMGKELNSIEFSSNAKVDFKYQETILDAYMVFLKLDPSFIRDVYHVSNDCDWAETYFIQGYDMSAYLGDIDESCQCSCH